MFCNGGKIMDKMRRTVLASIAVSSGALAYPKLLQQNSKGHDMLNAAKETKKSTIKLEKKILNLKYDLAFPTHHHGSSYMEKLANIGQYMRSEGLKEEQFCKGKAITKLENKVAKMFGKEAALWCPTGTLAQGIAIQIHGENTQRKKLQMHPSSHLLIHEHRGFGEAHGFQEIVSGEWRETLNANHIDASAACTIVEMGQRHSGGLLPSWQELQSLKKRAKALNVPLHMDGARVWSARNHYDNRPYSEIADGFSSIYVSFYKDIGACGGAALIGDSEFIEKAKIWRGRLGGLVTEHWPQVCDTLRLLDKKLVQVEHNVHLAKNYAEYISQISDLPVFPKTPHTNLFHILLPYTPEQAKQAHLNAAKESGIWITNAFWNYEDPNECAMEITITETASTVPEDELKNALAIFFKHLKSSAVVNS